jgi:hypothetical protein
VKKKPLNVSLHAREPSVVELTVGDRVQLDRLTPSPRGYLAERHGRLLDPGVTTVALPAGHYFFKTLLDANLRVVAGGVSAGIVPQGKDPWPEPPPPPPAPSVGGDEPTGESPCFTVEPT